MGVAQWVTYWKMFNMGEALELRQELYIDKHGEFWMLDPSVFGAIIVSARRVTRWRDEP